MTALSLATAQPLLHNGAVLHSIPTHEGARPMAVLLWQEGYCYGEKGNSPWPNSAHSSAADASNLGLIAPPPEQDSTAGHTQEMLTGAVTVRTVN